MISLSVGFLVILQFDAIHVSNLMIDLSVGSVNTLGSGTHVEHHEGLHSWVAFSLDLFQLCFTSVNKSDVIGVFHKLPSRWSLVGRCSNAHFAKNSSHLWGDFWRSWDHTINWLS